MTDKVSGSGKWRSEKWWRLFSTQCCLRSARHTLEYVRLLRQLVPDVKRQSMDRRSVRLGRLFVHDKQHSWKRTWILHSPTVFHRLQHVVPGEVQYCFLRCDIARYWVGAFSGRRRRSASDVGFDIRGPKKKRNQQNNPRMKACSARYDEDAVPLCHKAPSIHQQQCRRNVRLCCPKAATMSNKFIVKSSIFDKVETNWTGSICFDFVERKGKARKKRVFI